MDNPCIKPCQVVLEQYTPKMEPGLSEDLRKVINEKNILTIRTREKVLSDLDEINNVNVENYNKNYRTRAMEEILSSEISYLHQLELVKEFFMKPIKDGGYITAEEYQSLFGCIRTIYNISSELLRALRRDKVNIAESFSKIAPFLKLYSVYAYDYKKSLNMLEQARVNNLRFSKFLENQESRPEVKTKLSALLIAPIQRVPRYCLLLKQVLSHTSPSHSSYSLLTETLNTVEKAAAHINSLIEEQENSRRLLELQRSLIDCLYIIKPDRKFIKEGILMQLSYNNKKKNAKRYFVLLSDILMYCKLKKENPNSSNSLKCICILPLKKCKITENLTKGAFTIICQEEEIVVYHIEARVAQEWVKVLKETIKSNINNRRTLRKDSSSRRPVHKNNFKEYEDLGISPGQPRRKKLIKENDFMDVYKNTSEDIEDTTKTCFSIKATKRKPIRNSTDDEHAAKKMAKFNIDKIHDSLFPLRQRLTKITDDQTSDNNNFEANKNMTNNSKNNTSIASNDNEVFVFGNQNPARGFRFTMSNILTGLCSSFKRAFGLQN